MKIQAATILKYLAVSACALIYATLPLIFTGCSGTPIEEGEYVDGMETDSAVVEAVPGGGYKTLSGDPIIATNGNFQETSMLPYGGGDQGIRTMEDETPFYSTN